MSSNGLSPIAIRFLRVEESEGSKQGKQLSLKSCESQGMA